MFLQIPLDKISPVNKVSVMKGHVALLLLFTEHEIDLSVYISKLVSQLNSITDKSVEGASLPVMKMLIDGLIEIFKLRQGFELGSHNLLGM